MCSWYASLPPETAPLGERSLDAEETSHVAPEYFLKKEAANDDLGFRSSTPATGTACPFQSASGLWTVSSPTTVTLFSGDGGSGKSMASISLMIAMALGLPWFDLPVTQGPTLYFGAEDEQDELHIRINAILATTKTFADLVGRGVRLIPMADRDPVLARRTRTAAWSKPMFFRWFARMPRCCNLSLSSSSRPRMRFGGDERTKQVRRFISMLRALAIKIDCSVLLLSHPSVAGMTSGSGLSGSTAWNNRCDRGST